MKYKLSEIFDSPISGEWGTELQEGQQGYKVIRTTNFTNQGRLNLSDIVSRNIDIDKCSKKVLQVGDIIIEKSGGSPNQPVGRVVFFDVTEDEYYFCNNFTAILRPKEFVYPKYGLYLMKMLYIQRKVLKFQNKTTGIINLKLNDYLNQTSINLPSFETQERIANILDQAQELIDKRKAQIEALDELIQSVFYDMFGDPINNLNGYNKEALINISDIITGNTPSRKNVDNYGDAIEWIKSDNITNAGTYLTTAKEYLSEKGLNIGRSIEQNSILMTCIAGSLKCIGNVAIADRKVAFNQQINGIQTLDNNVFFMFEQFNLSQSYIQSTINMALKGILSKSQLSELEFIFPPIELQNEFANFFNQVDKLKFTYKFNYIYKINNILQNLNTFNFTK